MRFLFWVNASGGPMQASRLLGVSRTTLYHWLVGKKEPNFDNRQRIYKESRGAVTALDLEELKKPKQRMRKCPCCGRVISWEEWGAVEKGGNALARRSGKDATPAQGRRV
jgi:hypothetical protein